jgi:hypothetical protein
MSELASLSPIVRAIIIRVLRVEMQHLKVNENHRINTDLIPNFSDKHNSKAFQESIIHILPPLPKIEMNLNGSAQLPQPSTLQEVEVQPITQQIQPVQVIQESSYGRLGNFINDRSIIYIECSGYNIPISVTKLNQKQKTNISLTEGEVKSFLNYISEKSKIPIIDGVFRIVVDGMLINGVVSDSIGTKFMIKKNYQIQ